MKKNLSSFLVLVVLISVLCIMPAFSEGTTEGQPKKAEYVMLMANPSSPEDACVKAFFKFEEIVEEKSEGRIDVQVKHSGQLGGHRDYIEGLQMGSIQLAEINTSVLSAIDDSFMVLDLPFLSKSGEHQLRVLESGVGESLSNTLEEKTGIRIIGWMIRPPRCVYSAVGPIETAADFKGLKIRVMESPVMLRTMQLLGAKPVPVSANERYMALQTGVVDAAENNPSIVLTEKEYEVTDYFSMTEHFNTPNIIAVDTKFLSNMPEDLQKIIIEAGEEAGEYATEIAAAEVNDSLKQLEEKGMKVNAIADKSSFIEAVSPIYAEYEDQIGKDLIDKFLLTD